MNIHIIKKNLSLSDYDFINEGNLVKRLKFFIVNYCKIYKIKF